MDSRRILRSPEVTQGVVTLSSALDAGDQVEKNMLEEQPESTQDIKTVAEIEPKVTESELESRLKKMIDAERVIEQREKELSEKERSYEEQFEKLRADAESYREEIHEEISQQEKQKAEENVRSKLEQMDQLLDALSERVQSEIDEVSDELVAIVFESVCKIIGEALNKDKSIVVSTVRQVMKTSQDRMEMTLRVSEKDYDVISSASSELSYGLSNRINIIADDHVRYGGCILETAAGRIDGRLEQQMNRLMQVLLNSRD